MSSLTPSPVLDLSNSDLFLPQKDTSEFHLIPKFLTKSLPIHSEKEEMLVKEEGGEEFLRKDMESASSTVRGSDEVDDTNDGFRTPEKKIPIGKKCPAAPIKPKPPVPFLTRKRKSSNVKFLFRFDLAKEIQESLLHHNSQEFSTIIKKMRSV